jgi:hypothetical protein
MRFKLACAGVVVALTCASMSWAQLSGAVYSSIDGSLQTARLTQSESEFEGPDQVFSIASWNGRTLGTEWAISCNLQTAPADVVVGLDRNGNGVVITSNVFRGGTFHLYQGGPWGGTLGNLSGKILTNQVVLTEYYQAGQVVSAQMVSEALGVGRLDRRVEFSFSRCMAWGEVEQVRAAYPDLLDQNCSATRVHGYWGDMADVTIKISKPVNVVPVTASPASGDAPAAVGPTTWGSMKIRYR